MTYILTKFEKYWVENVVLKSLNKDFLRLNLVDYFLTPPNLFKFDQDIIKTDTLTKFEADWAKQVAIRV